MLNTYIFTSVKSETSGSVSVDSFFLSRCKNSCGYTYSYYIHKFSEYKSLNLELENYTIPYQRTILSNSGNPHLN